MSEPQRYAVSGNYAQMIELTDGNYVRWSDYERLKYDLERVRKHRDTLSERLDKALEDINRSLFANSEWQPIETAPKDGTRIFAYSPVWKYPDWVMWGYVDHTDDLAWVHTHQRYNRTPEPVTHWMPLPKPPTE